MYLFEAWQHAFNFSQNVGRFQSFWFETARASYGNFWKNYYEDVSLFMVAI